ncbi:hypothetical protein SADUNF_Sadunf06G0006700 [Salix dunnii]|uniref:Uncharacterized protein n=1 Tax=Salix dunnii TaxID=1413687 RepID=A0A835N2K1_9ROSI|nr:hypothetical protein SADUNF_Sadunf06G0006700 [Salix dunnii]
MIEPEKLRDAIIPIQPPLYISFSCFHFQGKYLKELRSIFTDKACLKETTYLLVPESQSQPSRSIYHIHMHEILKEVHKLKFLNGEGAIRKLHVQILKFPKEA